MTSFHNTDICIKCILYGYLTSENPVIYKQLLHQHQNGPHSSAAIGLPWKECSGIIVGQLLDGFSMGERRCDQATIVYWLAFNNQRPLGSAYRSAVLPWTDLHLGLGTCLECPMNLDLDWSAVGLFSIIWYGNHLLLNRFTVIYQRLLQCLWFRHYIVTCFFPSYALLPPHSPIYASP